MISRLILAFTASLFMLHACAQDSVLLMNGRAMECTILSDSGTVLLLQLTKPNGKVIVREIHKNDVFSVSYGAGGEEVFYLKDEMLGNIYSVDEMRYYLAGENDARQNFDPWPTFAVGFALCAG